MAHSSRTSTSTVIILGALGPVVVYQGDETNGIDIPDGRVRGGFDLLAEDNWEDDCPPAAI